MLLSSKRQLISYILIGNLEFLLLIFANDCPIQEYDDCTSAMRHCNQNLPGQWPKRAMDLRASVKIDSDKLTFKVKWSAYVENVRCFLILVKSDGIPDICQVKNCTTAKKGNYTRKFETRIPFTKYNRDYMIKLYTLPQQNSSPTALKKKLYPYDCSNWKTDVQPIYDGNKLQVTFNKAPYRCNFTSYTVVIFSNSHRIENKTVYAKGNSSTLRVFFSRPLCKGKYKIEIRKTWTINDQECLKIDGSLDACTYSQSHFEDYKPRIPCKRNSTADIRPNIPEKENRLFLAIMILCVLAVILVIVFMVYIFMILRLKPKHRGLVFFTDDHPAHYETVMKLVKYLRECHLEVNLASNFLKHPDDAKGCSNIFLEVLKSDFLLLVFSSAFEKRTEAWDNNQDYIEFFKETNSSILTKTFLQEMIFSKKLYVCKFDHVIECVSLSEPCYSLPSQLKEMVKKMTSSGFNLSYFKFFQKRKLLKKLNASVKNLVNYECRDSEWFHKKYFCPSIIYDRISEY